MSRRVNLCVQRQQGVEYGLGEHVAAGRALVAQDAVEQQVSGELRGFYERNRLLAGVLCAQAAIKSVVSSQIGRAGLGGSGGQRGAGFLLPDKGGKGGKAHVGVDAAARVEYRRAQAHETKAAAVPRAAIGKERACVVCAWPPADCFADAALLAGDDLFQAWQAVGGGVFAHFDADPAAAHFVGHGSGGAGAEEAVEDEVVGVGGDL